MKFLAALMMMTLVACKPDTPQEPPPNTSTAATTGQTAAQTAAQVNAPTPVWTLEVDGKPELLGDRTERRKTSDEGYTVGLFGADASVRFGTNTAGDVTRMAIAFADKSTCSYQLGQSSAKLTLQMKGDRGELSGQIPCGPAGSAEMSPTNISGWFVAKLAKERKPVVHESLAGQKPADKEQDE